MKIRDIIGAIEEVAPLGLQESWDNSGLQIGSYDDECTGVLLCVDPVPEIVAEAVEKGCNLIVSHHPLLFSGLKSITGSTLQQRVVIDAIKAGVSIYSSHTALDSSRSGVSARMASMLGLENVEVLDPRRGDLEKLTVMVPSESLDRVRSALFDAGAGSLGSYDCCGFSAEGTGTFRPLDGAHPYIGAPGEISSEPETRLEVMLPVWLRSRVEKALRGAHPYEEPAYEFAAVTAGSFIGGLGCVGNLREPMPACDFARFAAGVFSCPAPRVSAVAASSRMVDRVALCGGAGGSLLRRAIASGAQIYVSADLRYHDYVDYGRTIGLVDVGHFNSEECAKTIFYQRISEKFPNFAVNYATTEKNPIEYL